MKKLIYLFSLLFLPLSASFAQASFTVTSNADDGPGSLREAIGGGISSGSSYIIYITTAGPISLTAALPDLVFQCTIVGASSLTPATASGGTIIERASGAPNFRIFNLSLLLSFNLALQDLILQNGVAADGPAGYGGGAVLTNIGSASLTMTRCLIRNCSAVTSRQGGGVHAVTGAVILTDCQFSNNSATNGGALRSGDSPSESNFNTSPINLLRCTFDGNQAVSGGAAYFTQGGPLTLTNSTFSNNQSSSQGNVLTYTGLNMNFANCSFVNNKGSSRTISTIIATGFAPPMANCLFSNNINMGSGVGNFDLAAFTFIASQRGNVSSDADDSGVLNQAGSDKTGVSVPVGALQRNNGVRWSSLAAQ